MHAHHRIYSLFLLVLFTGAFLFSCQKKATNNDEQNSIFTSHQFTWQKIAFTQMTPDIISVIAQDDIWITGNSGGNFSAFHWDGKTLNRVSIYDPLYQSIKKYFSDFVAMADNDLYFVDGNVSHSDGQTMVTMYNCDYENNEFFQTLWMETPGDIYAAGRKSIIHFNGQEWSRFATGVDDPVVDIWGSYPKEGAAAKIIGLISPLKALGVRKLITLSKGVVKDTLRWPDDVPARHLWFDNKSPVYVQGKDLWQYGIGGWQKVALDGSNLNALHGSAWNNIFVVGDKGYVAHFNGKSWQSYPQLLDDSGAFESVCVKGNVVAIAGRFAPKGYLLIGIQQTKN